MNQALLKFCAAFVVELHWVLSEVECVGPRIEIDLAVELFNLETWNFQERYNLMCFSKKCLKSCKTLRNLVVREKNKRSSLGRI